MFVERRRYPRVSSTMSARASNLSEAVSPPVSVIDVSLGGVLVAYAEPAGLVVDDRAVVCFELSIGTAVLLGRGGARCAGTDFRTYVAVQFADGQDEEVDRLAEELRREHPHRRLDAVEDVPDR